MPIPPSRPRLLLVGPTYPFRGGIAHHTTLLFRALRRRYDTELVSFRRQYIQWLYPGETDRDVSGAPITEAGVRHDIDVLVPTTLVTAGRRAAAFDVVLLPWWTAFWAPYYLLLLAGLRRRARVLFICHNVVDHEGSRLKRSLTAAVLRRGDAFLVQSGGEKAVLEQMVGRDRPIAVAHHPSYDVFDRGVYDRASARERLGLPADAEVLLFFGFVRPYKGLDDLLDAFARLARTRERLHLLVVGECWGDVQTYRERARSLGIERCRMVLEYVPNEDVEAYMKASDLVVLPYRSGTGSGIAQIALAMDIPVIATQIAAFEDVVIDGETGRLVPPADAHALERAIDEALEPDALAAMRAHVARDKGRFSWDVLVDRIAELIGPC